MDSRSPMFPWQRLWYPQGNQIVLDHSGFLFTLDEHGSIVAKYVNSELRSIEEMNDVPCLILLGEAGMGKSQSLEFSASQLEAKGELVLRVSLGSWGTAEQLVCSIFENETSRSWMGSSRPLYLFLDALDEGLDLDNRLDRLLVEELKARLSAAERSRLRLRLACRVSRWPRSLEDSLDALWSDRSTESGDAAVPSSIAIRQLAPLSREQVADAARLSSIDASSFLGAVETAGVGPLAAKPITMLMLFRIFRRRGDLPGTIKEIYEQGCRVLCEDENLNRRERRLRGRQDSSQRFELASRIAAVTMLSNRRQVRLGDSWQVEDHEVTPAQLVELPSESTSRQFGENDVEDLIEFTGLFAGAGPGVYSWAHQSFAEFLAALYLHCLGKPSDFLVRLLRHPDQPTGVIVTPLHGVATWLAGMDPAIFDVLLATEPGLLLKSDLLVEDPSRRKLLVESLLAQTDSERFHFFYHLETRLYSRLDHPDLDDQLMPLLRDRSRGFGGRMTAIWLASSCKREALLDPLRRIALAPEEHPQLRISSISALAEIASLDDLVPLRSVLQFGSASLEEYQISAKAAELLWPDAITFDELLTLLSAAEQAGYLGQYQGLLSGEEFDQLDAKDLIRGLDWLGCWVERGHSASYARSVLAASVLCGIWRLGDEHPEVIDALAAALITWTDAHVRFAHSAVLERFGEEYAVNQARRITLLRAIARRIEPSKARRVMYSPWGSLAQREDAEALLDLFRTALTVGEKEVLAFFIRWILDPADERMLGFLYAVAQTEPILARELRGVWGPIALDSDEATYQRESHEHNQELAARKLEEERLAFEDRERRAALPSRLDEMLERVEKGEYELWWEINWFLRFGLTRERDVLEGQCDIGRFPGWCGANAARRKRILSAATAYLRKADPHTEEWIKRPRFRISRRADAAYSAFRLLMHEDGNAFASFDRSVWRRWAPAIFRVLDREDDDLAARQRIYCLTLRYAAPGAIQLLRSGIVNALGREGTQVPLLGEIDGCFSEEIGDVLWGLARPGPGGRARRTLMGYLFGRGWQPAREWLFGRLEDSAIDKGEWDEDHLLAAAVLMQQLDSKGWGVLWSLHQRAPSFCRKLWLSLTGGPELASSFSLPPGALADVYLWLERELPWQERPARVSGQAYSMGPFDVIEEFQRYIVKFLIEGGSNEALTALRRIVEESKRSEELRWHLLDAERAFAERTYSWLSPRDILAILVQPGPLRLIRSSKELIEAVFESLGRLELELHGETPTVEALWDRQQNDNWRPKLEHSLSNHVKTFLDRDLGSRGAIANREVEVKHRVDPRGEAGQRTDIHIDVRNPSTGRRLTVIVEVKGCWNKGVVTSMSTQLVDRYLAGKTYSHGIYLVGWFHCAQWPEGGDCKHAVPIEALTEELQAEARRLSASGNVDVRAFVLDAALR